MIVQDDRTPTEVEQTIGFLVATDSFMSGWGEAPGRSIVACPVVSSDDAAAVEKVFDRRSEFKRVRWIAGQHYTPRLRRGDHLHIYDTQRSFRRVAAGGNV